MNIYIQMAKKVSVVTMSVSIAIWAIGYFFLCFTEWYMLNPIQWIIDLPIASQGERSGYLGLLLGVTTCSFIGVLVHADLSDDTATGGHTINNIPISYPSPSTQRSESSLDAVDIALGVASGVVIGGIIGDILD